MISKLKMTRFSRSFGTLSLGVLLGVLLTSCQSGGTYSDADSGGPVKFNDPVAVDKTVVEAFVHMQPDPDLSYNVPSEDFGAKTPEGDDEGETTAKHYKKGTDSEIWKRLRAGFRLKMVSDPQVDAEIRWLIQHPDYIERVFDRADLLLHYVLEKVERRGVPSELALLPVVESAFQPYAYSHARASGIWQFIPSTGRLYGLKIDWWYDGRRDIVNSTRASLDYLQKLSAQFHGDWLLALASYNSGEGRVEREVNYNKRRGQPASFWNLRLPKETQQYVPKLLAVRAIVENPQRYGLDLRHIPDERRLTEINVGGQIDLAIVAELAGMSLEDVYKLNPGFNQWATAPTGPHILLLPITVAKEFKSRLAAMPQNKRVLWQDHTVTGSDTLENLASRFKITREMLAQTNNISGRTVSAGTNLRIPISHIAQSKYTLTLAPKLKGPKLEVLPDRRKVTYRARRGDTINSVARRYGVSGSSLARWNYMSRGSRLRSGQRVTVYISATERIAKRSGKRRTADRSGGIIYVVRRNDTLMRVSRKYNVSVSDIRKWNKLIRHRNIYPGLRLKIYQ